MTRRSKGALIITVALVAGGISAALSTRSGSASTDVTSQRPRATAVLETRDLVESETFGGVLNYADARAISSSLAGTITWLPDEGERIGRGARLYEIDAQPSFLMYGRGPAWRDLGPATGDGGDVRQLERNLVALGYDPYDAIVVDREFDDATADAIRRWQEDRGMAEDGTIALGEIVFAQGPRRVGELHTSIGERAGPGVPVFDLSSTQKLVSIDLEAAKRDLVRKGQKVTITMPDRTTVEGQVAEVGKVAHAPQEQGGSPTVDVNITVKGGRAAFDRAPVEVEIEVARTKDALAAPVSALLALAEGGYALEVVDGDSTALVGVEIGEFSDGWVEITGEGLSAGDEVVIAP